MASRQFALTIKLGNDAMRTLEDVADALESVARSLRVGTCYGQTRPIHDINGNRVGEWKWPER